jgi:hypothetical protein
MSINHEDTRYVRSFREYAELAGRFWTSLLGGMVDVLKVLDTWGVISTCLEHNEDSTEKNIMEIW